MINTKPTILYVEDEDGVRKQLSKFLKYSSDKLYIAKDGQEGLDFYQKHKPDIVVTDIKMPNMNGIEMVKAIKKINAKQYIVFTSAHSETDYFLEAIDMQVDGFILKPVDLDKLELKLEHIKEQINIKKELISNKILTKEITQLHDNMLFVLDKKKKVIFANKIFLEFFNVETLGEFHTKHKCVANMFIQNPNFYYPKNDEDWVDTLNSIEDETQRVISMLDSYSDPQAFLISIKFVDDTSHSIAMLTEITNLTIQKDEFESKAYTDELTQISNRAFFEKEFEKNILNAKVASSKLSIIMLDIDKFKNFNDTYGHQMGDAILKDLAKVIRDKTRESDVFTRWGGEEFVKILPGSSLENAKKIAQELRKSVENHVFNDGLRVTCSFGVAELKEDDTKESLMKRVDEALYLAKENGRNRVEG